VNRARVPGRASGRCRKRSMREHVRHTAKHATACSPENARDESRLAWRWQASGLQARFNGLPTGTIAPPHGHLRNSGSPPRAASALRRTGFKIPILTRVRASGTPVPVCPRACLKHDVSHSSLGLTEHIANDARSLVGQQNLLPGADIFPLRAANAGRRPPGIHSLVRSGPAGVTGN
jgi:hypothetical protein